MNPEQIRNEGDVTPAEETAMPTINQPVIRNEQPKKTSRWKRIVILIALIIVAIPILGYLLLVISFSGGIDGVLSDLKSAPDPKSSKVTAKRNISIEDIEREFSHVEEASNLTSHTSSTYDNCYKGQNNWKVKEGYAHRCDYRITRYYGFSGDFRITMLEFDKDIKAIGWQTTSDRSGLSYVINNYYDQYYGNKDAQVNSNFGGTYLVSDMPKVYGGYTTNGISMSMAYVERSTKDLYDLESAQGFSMQGFPFYQDKQFKDIKTVFNEITSNNTFVLAISLQKNYFEN
jgi:hypothetical protein